MISPSNQRLEHTKLGAAIGHRTFRRLLAMVQMLLLVYFGSLTFLLLWLGRSMTEFDDQRIPPAWSVAIAVVIIAGVCILISGIVAFWLEPNKLPRARYWMLLACAAGNSGTALLLVASLGLSLMTRSFSESAAMHIAWHAIAICLLLPTSMSALVQMSQARAR